MRAIAATLIIAIFISESSSAWAQTEPHRPRPSDFIPFEFLASSLAATGIGLGGAFLAIPLGELDPLGWVEKCYQSCEQSCHCGGRFCFSPCFCQLCEFEYVNLGAAIGISIGATAGVAIAGSLAGVKGNVPLAFAGSVAGELSSIFLMIPALELRWDGWLAPTITLLSTSLGATVGYNIGATMKSEQMATELAALLFQVSW